jgi:phosphoesterase RecJ-like protein
MFENYKNNDTLLGDILTEEEAASFTGHLETAQQIMITCHVSPDGDAVGAITAMANFLRRKGKLVHIITPNIHPDFLKWIPGAETITPFEKNEARCIPVIKACDLFICLDFNSPGRLETLGKEVLDNPAPKLMFDHHLGPDTLWTLAVSHPEMSSTCELLFRVLTQIDGFKNLTFKEATCLYTGMMTDTGGFTYNSNRSDIYYIISLLLQKGIDKDQIYRNVFNNYTANRFRLLGYMLNEKMLTFPEYHASIMSMTRAEQKRYNHKKGDTEGFVNIPLQIKGVILSIFLRENTEKDTVRVSLRSIGDFPCNEMAAEFFNGGGHKNASGGELVCSVDEAINVAKIALIKYQPLLQKDR